jgi:hypothetical protein
MLPHEQKHQNNLCEYLMYLQETQDMIREKGFEPEKIRDYALEYSRIAIDERQALADWYMFIAGEMIRQNVVLEGNLEILSKLFKSLSDLNIELIRSDQVYRLMYDKAKVKFAGLNPRTDLPTAPPFSFLFEGFRQLTIARRVDQNERIAELEGIGEILSYLSYKHKQRNQNSEKAA